jgi:hypothetical protein
VDHGKVIADDTLRGLEKLVPESRRLVVELDDADGAPWLADLRAVAGVEAADVSDHTLRVSLADLARAPEVLAFLAGRKQRFTHFGTERTDLEGIFLALTGRNLRDA